MPDRSSPDPTFGPLDAARIVARGGRLENKLAALSAGAAAVTGASSVAILLHDADSGILMTADGSRVLPLAEAGETLNRALRDREAIRSASAPEVLASVLPGMEAWQYVPLHVEDDMGIEVEGVLALGWPTDRPVDPATAETLSALADLIAVAIHLARLRNTLWERSDFAEGLAHTDRLTGLANRITFERMLELEVARATRQSSPLAVAVFDVDGLRALSESRGAGSADSVLRHVAAALADRVRLLDTVARFGDESFAVIAPGDASGIVARRLRDAIASLPSVDDVEISVSAAVVHHPRDGASGGELLAATERVLQLARQAGPGAVIGAPEAAA